MRRKMILIGVASLVVGAAALTFGVLCLRAARGLPRTGAKDLETETRLAFDSYADATTTDEAAPLDRLLAGASRIGLAGVRDALLVEAGRYGAVDGLTRTVRIDGFGREISFVTSGKLERGGVFLFVRLARVPEGSGPRPRALEGLKPVAQDRSAIEEEIAASGEATSAKKVRLELLRKCLGWIEDPDRTYVTFGAAFDVVPRKGGGSFVIRLLAYRYPVLGAHHSGASVPGLKGKGLETAFSVSLDGPLADPAYRGGAFHAAATFPVTWDREGGIPGWTEVDPTDPTYRSPPYRSPSFRDFTLEAKLVEATEMKSTLEDLAAGIDAGD